MAMGRGSASGDQTVLGEINVTPLVDVMLVLLIIFMVAAPLVHQQVDVDLPATESAKAAVVNEKDIVLIINAKREIFIGKNAIPFDTLTSKLAAIYQNKQKKEIFLQADQSIPYGFVVQVMAKIKKAGIPKMGMITDSAQSSS